MCSIPNAPYYFVFSTFQTVFLAGNDRSILLNYVTRESVEKGSKFKCTMCGKTNSQKNNIVNHIEGIHFPGSFIYRCELCSKTMKTKNALYLHNSIFHKDKN